MCVLTGCGEVFRVCAGQPCHVSRACSSRHMAMGMCWGQGRGAGVWGVRCGWCLLCV